MKKTIVTIGTAAIVFFTGSLFTDVNPASAERTLQEVQEERKELKSKLSTAEKEVAEIMEEITKTDQEINQLSEAIKENNREIKKVEKRIAELEKEIEKLQEEINLLQIEIEKRDQIIKNRIAAYQANGGNVQLIEIFYGVKDFNDFISRATAAITLTNADQELLQKQEEEKQKVVDKQNEVEAKLAEQEDMKAEIEAIIETIEGQKEDLEKEKKKQKEVEKKLKSKINKLKLKDSDLARIESSLTVPVFREFTAGNNGQAGSSENGKAQNVQTVAYSGAGGSALSAGSQFIGKSRYAFGARNPSAGLFDCSGFVQWAYAQEGISLPGNTNGMASVGTAVSPSDMKPGDLVFFDTYKKNGHVGIYAGNGKFLGSQSSTGVSYANMNSGYWKSKFSGHVRRVK